MGQGEGYRQRIQAQQTSTRYSIYNSSSEQVKGTLSRSGGLQSQQCSHGDSKSKASMREVITHKVKGFVKTTKHAGYCAIISNVACMISNGCLLINSASQLLPCVSLKIQVHLQHSGGTASSQCSKERGPAAHQIPTSCIPISIIQ